VDAVTAAVALGGEADARKARAVELDPDLTASEALSVIVAECTDHWRTNEALLLGSRAMAHLHQTRVGIRRLRSSFSLFRPVLREVPHSRRVAHRLRTLALPLGPARDLDVLLAGPLMEDLDQRQVAALRAERETAYGEVISTLRSKRWAEAGEALDALVERLPSALTTDQPVLDVAAAALEKRWRRVARTAGHVHRLPPAARHRVRIEAKKLRYGCEFFSSLYAVSAPHVVTAEGEVLAGPLAFAWHVEQVQTALGLLNDHATADHLLRPVGAKAPEVDEAALVEAGAQATDALAEVPPFWR
jgi:CHAD domain-containing protein